MIRLTVLGACKLLCLVLLAGCSKEDAGPAINAAQVVGSWQITKITADPAVTSPTYGTTTDVLQLYQQNIGKDCVGPTRYEFAADGALHLTTSTDCQNKLNSLFGFTAANWHTTGRQLRVEGNYDALSYTVSEQSPQTMVWQRTEYNSPYDGKTHLYTITLSKR
ncbi:MULTISPECIES: lipocalin family protein [Spirosoma]|uniref:Lipocalin family protein n=1 Tax=Spirosoma liriopis TaxID=2937440 RepID=A0ABT0HTT6_9BACT|nr:MULTISPECIES: lipocalin family protein [Spirosoma]MCK8495564.1 lipocalin family protein [Spirosoma liriopis]UHG94582.1 lipocalin family protein [Spirosoma oryzicola]